MYDTAKRKQIKDLFFLSREGQYLKKLFDSYQESTKLHNEWLYAILITMHSVLA